MNFVPCGNIISWSLTHIIYVNSFEGNTQQFSFTVGSLVFWDDGNLSTFDIWRLRDIFVVITGDHHKLHVRIIE